MLYSSGATWNIGSSDAVSRTAMISNRVSSFPVLSKLVKQPLSVEAAGSLYDSTQTTPASQLPSTSAPKATLWRELFSFAVDALDLRSWREASPMACFLLAGFIAI